MNISVFASACGLSVKTLRFYDERGLLPPAAVDPANGYRSYTATQLRQARTIRILRATGMPLELIGQALDEPDRMDELVRAHRAQVGVERDRQDRALTIADDLGGAEPQLAISTREVPETHWAAVAYVVDAELDEAEVEAVNAVADEHLGRLLGALAAAANPPIGQFWTAIPLSGPGPVTVRLVWPVAAPLPADFAIEALDVRHGTLPARTEAYVRVPLSVVTGGRLDDLPGGALPDPTWITFAEYCEASAAEPDELRQTTFGQSEEDWEVEYAATLSVR